MKKMEIQKYLEDVFWFFKKEKKKREKRKNKWKEKEKMMIKNKGS